MRASWKVVAPVCVALPMAAYLAGTLIQDSAEDPAPRAPIVLVPATTGSSSAPAPERSGGAGEETDDPDDGADDTDDGAPAVVRPDPVQPDGAGDDIDDGRDDGPDDDADDDDDGDDGGDGGDDG